MNKILLSAAIFLFIHEAYGKASRPESYNKYLERRLMELTESDDFMVDRESCPVEFVRVGCYKDKPEPRAMGELLFSERGHIEWNGFGPYVDKLACQCAKAAMAKGYSHFGLQFYGECWSSSNSATSYYRYGDAVRQNDCINGNFQNCQQGDTTCVGGQGINFVYEMRGEGSGNGGDAR